MTDVGAPGAPSVIKPIAELFRGDCVAFWATTYNVDLALFNEYLLGRLGDPPLNIVILADQRRLDDSLAAVPVERLDVLSAVNRRWLLRGAQVGSGRFHPKSYLTVTARTAKLLVGSGNLSTNGIDAGRELFTAFVSGTPVGDAALATWRGWMRRLIAAVDDTRLAARFADLEGRLPTSAGPTPVVGTPLWHNLSAPLADQFVAALPSGGVDELIVTAPFFDEHGEALGRLVDRLQPRRVRLYTTSSTSVDGHQLAARLASTGATVEALAYLPDRFTHAKLVGVTLDGRGWLLSGSANLSHAALTLPAGPGNVELAVFAELSAEKVREAFVPPEVTVEARSLATLGELTYDAAEESETPAPVRISRASLVDGGRIQVATDPAPETGWRLADHHSSQPLIVEGVTASTVGALLGPLVHLVDSDGAVLSNRIVVDDPPALAQALQVGERSSSGKPPELTSADLDTPLGAALVWLHQHMVMDVTEAAATGGSTGGVGNDDVNSDSADDDNLWERLERETLGRDPRVGTYGRLLARAGTPTGVPEPLIELLDAMRHRVTGLDAHRDPSASLLALLARPLDTDDEGEPSGGTGHRWTPSARIRVRARNVLRRWAAAQTDPRLMWVDPLAPLGNLRTIAAVFATLWRQLAGPDVVVELSDDDLDDLWGRWFRPFVGSGQNDGWLDRADIPPDQLSELVGDDFIENVTALCWLAIRSGSGRRARVVSWQPALRAAFDRDLIGDSPAVASYLTVVTGLPVSTYEVANDLLTTLTFTDDPMWCEQTAASLDLGQLELDTLSASQGASVRLNVSGIENPLYDPRVPQLIVAVRQYRSADAVAGYSKDHAWRLVVATGAPATYLPDLNADAVDSDPIEVGIIEGIAASSGVIADVFRSHPKVA